MAISELTLHHVLQTYSRQERLGQAQRARLRSEPACATTSDPVSLSCAGRKVQWLGHMAERIVEHRHPDLPRAQRTERVRTTAGELLARHGHQVLDDEVTPEALEDLLRSLYLAG